MLEVKDWRLLQIYLVRHMYVPRNHSLKHNRTFRVQFSCMLVVTDYIHAQLIPPD